MAGLTKIEVTAGVFVVDAPAIGLRVLCGCPADAVKHLMKRGLIVPVELNGVACETGPNAILLSDLMLQNGQFSNLAEFPILQMLYRQGLILPGHPNNTGAKPMLIGLREQVDAQLQYIYRGNYGLVTEEEILETGIPPDMARDMMRLKLRFAFGTIRHPRELLEAVYLEDEPVAIHGGLILRRLGRNVFEFALRGERVTVDLNLPPNVQYDVPYPLGMHQLKREYFAVIHSGEGDGWDVSRPAMGTILMFQGRIYLIDVGPNIHATLAALGIGANEIEGVFHTHAHDDHFAGMTTLMQSDHRIKHYATPLVRASVAKKLAALMSIEEEAFADYFDARDLTLDNWNDIEGLQVMPVSSPHPVETTVFLFRALWEGGWRTYAHFADIVTLDVLESMVIDDPGKPGVSREYFEKIKSQYAIPVDVKKLDIGGGLIHGQARDFRGDQSRKIILSHIARAYTDEEKEIGSGAPFGTADVLIPANQDYVWRNAHEYLRGYLPDVPEHQLRVLLNTPLVTFNPESILTRADEVNRDIFLVLTGTVEMIESVAGIHNIMRAGSLVGEFSGLHGKPSSVTYRAESFVQALRLPCDLYAEFIRENNLLGEITRLQGQREFLRRTWLFGDGLADPTLNRVASAMTRIVLAPKEAFDPRNLGLFLVCSGEGERRFGTESHGAVKAGDFLGAGTVLFGTPSLFSVRATTVLEAFAIPYDVLNGIPVIRWKLLESFARGLEWFSKPNDDGRRLLRWDNAYAVHVQRFDIHHRRLLVNANALVAAIEAQRGCEVVQEMFAALIRFAHYHFEQEETLLRLYSYPDLERHREAHQHFLSQAREILDRPAGASSMSAGEAATWLKDWIVPHVVGEDQKYTAHLHARGVY